MTLSSGRKRPLNKMELQPPVHNYLTEFYSAHLFSWQFYDEENGTAKKNIVIMKNILDVTIIIILPWVASHYMI